MFQLLGFLFIAVAGFYVSDTLAGRLLLLFAAVMFVWVIHNETEKDRKEKQDEQDRNNQ